MFAEQINAVNSLKEVMHITMIKKTIRITNTVKYRGINNVGMEKKIEYAG